MYYAPSRHGLGLCLLVILILWASVMVNGRPKAKGKKAKKDSKDELHTYKYRCNSKGVCKYQFRLTLPPQQGPSRNVTGSNVTSKDMNELRTQLEMMKYAVGNASKEHRFELDELRNAMDERVGRLELEHDMEIKQLKKRIDVLQNQTKKDVTRLNRLELQLDELGHRSVTLDHLDELRWQLQGLVNQTVKTVTQKEAPVNHTAQIANLTRQVVKLQLQRSDTEVTRWLKEEVADLRKQLKRGQKKQRKLFEQVTKLRKPTQNNTSVDKIVTVIKTPSLDDYASEYRKNFTSLSRRLSNIEGLYYGYATGDKYIYLMKPSTPRKNQPSVIGQDCALMRNRGLRDSGVYEIRPNPHDKEMQFFSYCDMFTDGGGWTVIQRRKGGAENFRRDWNDYKEGFGNPEGEFWLGLEKIHQLNKFGNTEIRFDMWDFHNKHRYAMYKDFQLSNETDKYRIEVGQYEGTAGDAFHYANVYLQQNRQQFSTYDSDNDLVKGSNCAEERKGGWWFKFCGVANLNGNYYQGGIHLSDKNDGIMWQPWYQEESLRKTEIKIRPLNF